MERRKRKRLERAGWTVGSVSEFLGLSDVENELVDMKLSLGSKLRKARERQNLTQTDLVRGGGALSRPRLSRIPRATSLSRMSAMKRSRPPQEQARASTS